jgi:hypothetical protein
MEHDASIPLNRGLGPTVCDNLSKPVSWIRKRDNTFTINDEHMLMLYLASEKGLRWSEYRPSHHVFKEDLRQYYLTEAKVAMRSAFDGVGENTWEIPVPFRCVQCN